MALNVIAQGNALGGMSERVAKIIRHEIAIIAEFDKRLNPHAASDR